jgi:hypothetical protein
MRFIELTRGYVAMVDDADFERLNQWKWHVQPSGSGMYAVRRVVTAAGKRTIRYLHHEVLGHPGGGGLVVDHQDGDPLNCRRGNLRLCTRGQNNMNRKPQSHNKWRSKYKGVSYRPGDKDGGKGAWVAVIEHENKQRYLGRFEDEYSAVKIYNVWAYRLHGKFAYLNRWEGPTGSEKVEQRKKG